MAKVEGPSGKANLEVQDTAVGRETVTVRRKVTLILPSETQASVAELMRKSGARDEAELFSIALGVLEFALWAKEQGYTVAAVNPEGRVVTEMERRKVRRLPLRLEFREQLAVGVLIGIGYFMPSPSLLARSSSARWMTPSNCSRKWQRCLVRSPASSSHFITNASGD